MTVFIQLTIAGSDSGPFNLFSDVNGFSSAFETNIDKITLTGGYAFSTVPDGTNIIRVMSLGLCTNYIDIPIVQSTTTTTTTSPCYCAEVIYIGESSADFSYVDCYGMEQFSTISTPSENYCGAYFSTESADISFNIPGDFCIFGGESYICPTTTTTTTIIL